MTNTNLNDLVLTLASEWVLVRQGLGSERFGILVDAGCASLGFGLFVVLPAAGYWWPYLMVCVIYTVLIGS